MRFGARFDSLSGHPARAATGWGLRQGLDEVNRGGVGVSMWWQCPLFIVRLEVDLSALFPSQTPPQVPSAILYPLNEVAQERVAGVKENKRPPIQH